MNNFFEIMKKRHNSAPWAPDEASPYLNESSRCAESESEEHFVRKAHFSAHVSVKKCYFPVKNKSQNWVKIKFQRNIWGQLDVRTRMRASKSWNSDLEKSITPIKWTLASFLPTTVAGLGWVTRVCRVYSAEPASRVMQDP